nr:immunoglobulin heavy chain junction region [Macaca mulatta]MOX59010.1 immunoglobulin heavy chain junction region [Macaca mulatta]MOX59851.1 immunoglobulin heavy chain junction region [Macaca mulatta]MOX61114.1 immunoglobulin heavy chain junction region [Macaca mulatta]MOX61469.1 immunoglobulin heavy chain junction region [Macaca mulatta]
CAREEKFGYSFDFW